SISAALPAITDTESDQSTSSNPSEPATRRVQMGEWEDVSVRDANAIPEGRRIEGPAILESEFTTVV
ncbi:MAG TPA: hypothetical protein DCF78_06055, partial [Dehalococcoidia bacterium]|nr:hypothetical protein [Dehalococcoidia bacterium]